MRLEPSHFENQISQAYFANKVIETLVRVEHFKTQNGTPTVFGRPVTIADIDGQSLCGGFKKDCKLRLEFPNTTTESLANLVPNQLIRVRGRAHKSPTIEWDGPYALEGTPEQDLPWSWDHSMRMLRLQDCVIGSPTLSTFDRIKAYMPDGYWIAMFFFGAIALIAITGVIIVSIFT